MTRVSLFDGFFSFAFFVFFAVVVPFHLCAAGLLALSSLGRVALRVVYSLLLFLSFGRLSIGQGLKVIINFHQTPWYHCQP